MALIPPTHLVTLVFPWLACLFPASVNPIWSLIALGAFAGKPCLGIYTLKWKQSKVLPGWSAFGKRRLKLIFYYLLLSRWVVIKWASSWRLSLVWFSQLSPGWSRSVWKKSEKKMVVGRPPSPLRPLICFMMQTRVLFHIGCSVTVAPRNKSSIGNTSRCKGIGKIWLQHQGESSSKSPKVGFGAQRVLKQGFSPETGVDIGLV